LPLILNHTLTANHKLVIVQVNLKRVPVNSGQGQRHDVLSLGLVNVSQWYPVGVLYLLLAAFIATRSPLRSFTEKPVHVILQ
jgi:hypothetical protein